MLPSLCQPLIMSPSDLSEKDNNNSGYHLNFDKGFKGSTVGAEWEVEEAENA